jgi:hypothetical protein
MGTAETKFIEIGCYWTLDPGYFIESASSRQRNLRCPRWHILVACRNRQVRSKFEPFQIVGEEHFPIVQPDPGEISYETDFVLCLSVLIYSGRLIVLDD